MTVASRRSPGLNVSKRKLIVRYFTTPAIPVWQTASFLAYARMFLVILLFTFGGCSRSVHGCSPNDAREGIKAFQKHSRQWEDAWAIAKSSPRISLSGPVAELQRLRRSLEEASAPVCIRPVVDLEVNAESEDIAGMLQFMDPDFAILAEPHFTKANAFRAESKTRLLSLQREIEPEEVARETRAAEEHRRREAQAAAAAKRKEEEEHRIVTEQAVGQKTDADKRQHDSEVVQAEAQRVRDEAAKAQQARWVARQKTEESSWRERNRDAFPVFARELAEVAQELGGGHRSLAICSNLRRALSHYQAGVGVPPGRIATPYLQLRRELGEVLYYCDAQAWEVAEQRLATSLPLADQVSKLTPGAR
jgi:hypothetical protein